MPRNENKIHCVSAADDHKLIETAPDVTWRCIIALARIGGVRVSSEIMPLTWGDVAPNIERNIERRKRR